MQLVFKNSFPVCFLSKSSILLFKNSSFFILDLSNVETTFLVKIKTSLKESTISGITIASRVLRKGVRCGIKISENHVLFVMGQRIYELSIRDPHISNGYITPDGSRPLTFSKISAISGFEDGIYFGGYKGNPDKDPISIYKRVGYDQWEEVFQFPSGTIEHIHNIIPDPHRDLVYILTGDFNHSAGIWKAEKGFKSVFPLLVGDQKFRGCVGFSTSDGLIYATDSPFSKNSIRILRNKGKDWESVHLMDINGPSIYGCQWFNDFVFSTSVEGGGHNQSILYKMWGNKRGEGVLENRSYIYKGNLNDGFKEIYSVQKDILPFFLFQFGVLVFASGLNESSYLPVYHIATHHNSMNTILL
jgi:hypothetical protein